MENSTPPAARRRRFARLLDAIDRFAFREPDLDALARGWTVRRDARFVRTYRDPRWDSVTACPSCLHRMVVGTACESCGDGSAGRVPPAGRGGGGGGGRPRPRARPARCVMSAGLRRLLPPPHRRPGLLAVLVRWRAELLALGLVTGLWHYAGGFAVGAVGTLLVLLTAFVPPVRVVVRDAVQAVVAMHRVRAGMVQAGIADRRGRVPWIVGATARKDIVLVSLWLHAGTVPDDLRGATAVLATACGAAEAQIHHRSLRQDRVVVAVVRPRWGWPTR